jgi:hypothetical protein
MIGVGPLKPGNYWKYLEVGGYSNGDVTCFYVTDSTRNLKGYNFNIVQSFESPNYIRYSSYEMLTTDSIYISYATYVPDSIYTYYKANCKIGDSWVQPVNEFATYTYSVIDTFHITAWGNSYFSKLIKITDFNVTEVYQIWVDHIGLMEEQSVGQYHMVLRGCVIDGIIYGDTTTIVNVKEMPYQELTCDLEQNFPNPFNANTKITFSIPKSSNISLKIYNSIGEEIDVLIEQFMNTGNYSYQFDASKLSSGIYFYRLTTNEYIKTKKMIVLK